MNLNPCQNCPVGEWGFCYHAEYGKCIHAKNKQGKVHEKKITRTDLEALNYFQLINVAEYLQVEYYEHFDQGELIEAILDKEDKEKEMEGSL